MTTHQLHQSVLVKNIWSNISTSF